MTTAHTIEITTATFTNANTTTIGDVRLRAAAHVHGAVVLDTAGPAILTAEQIPVMIATLLLASPPTAPHIAALLGTLAGTIADCHDLDARDRNAVIGQLRATAGQVRGLVGLPGYKQAPFSPTRPASPAQEPKP